MLFGISLPEMFLVTLSFGEAAVLVIARRLFVFCICLISISTWSVTFVSPCCGMQSESSTLPFEVPDGFVITKAADDRLAHDCFSMTIDALGRPIVSGPNYIKTLIDDNQDGIYDRDILWTSMPKQGAQGLWAEGRTIYFVSEGGLWQSEDKNGDLVADPSMKKLMELPTGREHDTHALRRGPDGYWYFIAGNFADNIANLQNDPNAPVAKPRAGTLWRVSPDFKTKAVWAHGMRNCYDFDFLPDGQIVTFDSDCEREASLPWYRPTRVFVLGPGSDAGWCGQTWKDHDYSIAMPQTIASLGRGSPTGVVVYQHNQFPSKYSGAVFVLDWTFGKVIAVYPAKNLPIDKRATGRIPAEVFMQTTGIAGFAPTDICVASDGSLLVCVGGRGTEGAIYRISHNAKDIASSEPVSTNGFGANSGISLFQSAVESKIISESTASHLAVALQSTQPWESWSEYSWRTNVDKSFLDGLLRVITGEIPFDPQFIDNGETRLRAAQLITRIGSTVPAVAIQRALNSTLPGADAAAWWLMGRGVVVANPRELQQLLQKKQPLNEQSQTAWGEHLGNEATRLRDEAFGLRRWNLDATGTEFWPDSSIGRAERRTWLWALSRSSASAANNSIPNRSEIARADGLFAKRLFSTTQASLDTPLIDLLASIVPKKEPTWNTRQRHEFLDMLQVALGDRKLTLPQQSDPPLADVMDGYRAISVRQLPMNVRTAWVDWLLYLAQRAATDPNEGLESECLRTLAMLEPTDKKSLSYLLALSKPSTHPTFDLQLLCCIAACSVARTESESIRTAEILRGVVRKTKDYGAYTDNQWPKRIQQLINALQSKDSALGASFLSLPMLCIPEEIVLWNAFSVDIQDKAKSKMREQLLVIPPTHWNSAVVKHCLQSQPLSDTLRASLREAATLPAMRNTAIELLSSKASEKDYAVYLDALNGVDKNVWPAAWRGIQSLDIQTPEQEFLVLSKLVSHVLNSASSLQAGSVLARCRQAANAAGMKGVPVSDKWTDWEPFLKANVSSEVASSFSQPIETLDWRAMIPKWSSLVADESRGRTLYEQKCLNCHGGQSALGPSLSGVARRFSREDLAKAIYDPSRDISDRFRSVKILTTDGEILTGIVVYTAADGTTLYTAKGEMIRINKSQIEEQAYSTESLMPFGLLNDCDAQQVADLFNYLGTLN